MDSFITREDCRLCGSKDLETVMEFPCSPFGDEFVPKSRLGEKQQSFPLNLTFCRNCAQLQLLDVVSPKVLYDEYLYETSTSLNLHKHFQDYAADVIRKIGPEKGSLVVDIGCNDGAFLRVFQESGLKALGVEPARAIAARTNASGIEALSSFFSLELAKKIRAERGPAFIISANNVMANIDNLDDFAEGIRHLLAYGGVFFFESGYVVDNINNSVIDNIHHEHLCYFGAAPLQKFFAKHELELIDVQIVDTKGGSLRGMVQHKGGPRQANKSVATHISSEVSQGFTQPERYKRFATEMDQVRKDLYRQLTELKVQGKTIAGYGAAVGATGLIYYYGLGEMIDFLVDDNTIKQGLFSPGHHIPVFSSSALYERKPDYVLILAWRYEGPIIKKHSEYLKNGGKFITPLPQIHTVRA